MPSNMNRNDKDNKNLNNPLISKCKSFKFLVFILKVTSKLAFQYCKNPRTDRPTPDQLQKYQFIIVEDWFCYPDFQNYYGPSNLAHVIRFCQIIEELHKENGKIVCVRTSPTSLQRSNVALLISIYLMIECKWSVPDICKEMNEIYETVIGFRTEGEGLCDHRVSIVDCLLGFQMALNHLPSLKLNSFNVEDLLTMEQPQNGDLNWIIPGKLLALAGPTNKNWPITAFLEYAEKNSIGAMVRLNREHYSAEEVTKTGTIEHIEMFMHDGTNPTDQNIRDFIDLVDRINTKGLAVAVHCRAGLGRTGTMIAAYLMFQYARDIKEMKHHQQHSNCPCLQLKPSEVARALIGYLRIMRPGSVLSGQPEFLESISESVMRAGSANNVNLITSSFLNSEVESLCIQIDNSLESIKDKDDQSIKIRLSKRIRLASVSSLDNLKIKLNKHPISHAGRGHAAEKHSSVRVEKL